MALSRKAQTRLIVVAAVLILLVGIGFLAYPFVSNYLLEQAQGNVIDFQQSAVEEVAEEDLSAERDAALAYNADLLGSRTVVTDPFDPAALRPQDGAYDAALNIAGDGVMGMLYIPRIQVEEPIYHTVDSDVLEKGVGHLEETSLPIGGESSHCVLSGHTGLPSGKIFDDLDQLEVGDYFIIQVLGEDHAYRIYDIETVLPEETQSLVIQQGRDLCTLVTCTPYGVNTHRLLVHAERCDVPDEWINKDAAQTFPDGYAPVADRSWLTAVGIGLLVAVVLIAVATLALRAVKRRRPVAEVPGGSARSEASSSPGRPVGVLPVLRGSGAARRAAADRATHRGKRVPDRNGRESDVRRGGKHFRE